MTRDWVDWHARYDEPGSSLARRLLVVQEDIRHALAIAGAESGQEVRAISMCAGDGRDLLPVLAERRTGPRVRALLVEMHPGLADRARNRAEALDLAGVEVLTGDAGTTTAYAGFGPAHVVLACGVFGNITPEDGARTVVGLRSLTAPGGIVIWTRGRQPASDPSGDVRSWFDAEGFVELAFTAPMDDRFRVGMNRLPKDRAQPFTAGSRLFSFVD